MKVRWTANALAQLDALAIHIARHNRPAAHRIALRIRDRVRSLAELPLQGRPGRIPETRELVIPDTRHIVAYRLGAETIDILAVIHQTRRWPRTL